jgi:hypothetical protein
VKTVADVIDILNFPRIVFCLSFVTLWASAWVGAWFRRRRTLDEDQRGDFNLIAGATLTLLGLIVGFSFSMSINRYDQRKNLEAEEANAIGTEYVRADLLPPTDRARVRLLLGQYLGQRVLFYRTRDETALRQVNAHTAQLQTDLWRAVQSPALAQPSSVTSLALAGMNDVLNSQGYTQAAWWNRIPDGAWVLMTAIAICANMLIGYGLRSRETRAMMLLVLPLVMSISFLLIADIDSARGGMIRVRPQNLDSLSHSLGTP